MKGKGAETGGGKSYSRIETYQKRDKDCGAEGHKHKLNSDNGSFQRGQSVL